jgi:hypothetical protein
LQSVALAPLYFPAEHEAQAADPVAFANWPAAQASQYVMPSPLCTLPISHAAQCAIDVCALSDLPYWPAMHSAQLLLASKLHEPAAHCPLHELLIEPPVPNRPAAQSAHAVRPVLLWYRPFAHATQWLLLARAIAASPMRPAAHELQTLTPAALYWPSGHSLHAVDSATLALN